MTAGTTYVASYHTNAGHYSVNRSYFTSPYSSGTLTVPTSGGVYLYGSMADSRRNSYMATNYWVDVLFTTIAPVDTTPPTVVSVTPAGASTNVATKLRVNGHLQRSA